MKKKILLVASSLVTGGLEKCLINLADNLDYDRYEVDLYLFNEGRALLPKLNKNVNLLPDSPYYALLYNRGVGKSTLGLLKKGKIRFAIHRLARFVRARLGRVKMTEADFEIMRRTMLTDLGHYDVAIGFEEGTACYYVAECVSADKKIGWIHTDISKITTNRALDERAFSVLDKVVTVSDNSLNKLKQAFPDLAHKFVRITVPALMNYDEVNALAGEPNNYFGTAKRILSVGRLVELKGFHLCVEATKMLLDDGFDVRWFVAGEGDYRANIEAEIDRLGVGDRFVLLGNCANPYTYMKGADVCVQPSSYEGYSVAVFEEKYFGKPVVVTGIPSNLEMIEDGVNGIVVERTAQSIYEGVKKLLLDEDYAKALGARPVKDGTDNATIIKEIEELFE